MTTIDELGACYELTTAKARYCRAIDTKDWEALSALMTHDVEFGITDADSDPDMTSGRDETLATLQSLVAGARTVHQVHSPELELAGHEARVIWAVQDRAVYDNGISVTGYGHYHERWVRQDGQWKVARLLLRHLITDVTTS